MYVAEKEMEGRQITQVVLSPVGLSVPIQRCAKSPLQGLGLRPQVPPFPILWATGMTRGLLGFHSMALEAGGISSSITGFETWAGDSTFLCFFVGSPSITWGNNEVSMM